MISAQIVSSFETCLSIVSDSAVAPGSAADVELELVTTGFVPEFSKCAPIVEELLDSIVSIDKASLTEADVSLCRADIICDRRAASPMEVMSKSFKHSRQ